MLNLNKPRVFETALDSLDVGVYWNRGAERISGYLRPDVTGRFCRDDILVHSEATALGSCRRAARMQLGGCKKTA